MMEMADRLCIIDFSLKGLKSRLLSGLIFPQLLRSFSPQRITMSEQTSLQTFILTFIISAFKINHFPSSTTLSKFV